MPTEQFKASVQYNDWKGSSAADSADEVKAENWLEGKGLKQPDEFLIGIEIYVGENLGKHKDPIYVRFLLVSREDQEQNIREAIEANTGPIEVRKVDVDMGIAEFLGLFKRFNVTISKGKMLEGREYTYIE